MTPFFISRIVGLVVFSIVGIRIGNELAGFINLAPEEAAFIFFWVGALFGLTATPWVTVAPVQRLRRAINEMQVSRLIMAAFGGLFGLVLALMLAFPLSLLEPPLGGIAPALVSIIFGYLGMTIVSIRASEILDALGERFGGRTRRLSGITSARFGAARIPAGDDTANSCSAILTRSAQPVSWLILKRHSSSTT